MIKLISRFVYNISRFCSLFVREQRIVNDGYLQYVRFHDETYGDWPPYDETLIVDGVETHFKLTPKSKKCEILLMNGDWAGSHFWVSSEFGLAIQNQIASNRNIRFTTVIGNKVTKHIAEKL